MKIGLKVRPITEGISRNIVSSIVGSVYRLLGNDKILHDSRSVFSVSNIIGKSEVNREKSTISYPEGGKIVIGFHDVSYLELLSSNVLKNPVLTKNLVIEGIEIIKVPKFRDKWKFLLQTPVFLQRDEEGNRKHYTYEDIESDEMLTISAMNKLKDLGLGHLEVKLYFDRSYEKKCTKVIHYYKNGKILKYKTSFCPVWIEGTKEGIEAIWSVGIGHCTGMGFGSVK